MGSKRLLRFIAAFFRVLSWPFVRVEYRGGASLHDHPSWIMSANHRSVFDFPLAVMALAHYGWDARIMIASEFWDRPHYAWAINAVDAIPVYRKTDPMGSLSAAVTALKEGDSTCIMPEGTLTWNPDDPLPMGRVKTGVSRLAVAADVPVLGIALVGTERVWPNKGRPRPWPRRTVVCRLADEPLWLTGDNHRANAHRVKSMTEALILEATRDLQAIDPTYMVGVLPKP